MKRVLGYTPDSDTEDFESRAIALSQRLPQGDASKRRKVDEGPTREDSIEESYESQPSASKAQAIGSNGQRHREDSQSSDDFELQDEEEEEGAPVSHTRRSGTARAAVNSEDSGHIEHIELVNFMCHKLLDVRLGPNINFIVGHNGSGKSAILTGITVALGAKATVTNRAHNLKTLIREGANVGQVSIRISNRGEDAYEPETFGGSITIERRFKKNGSNGYKIKGENGKVHGTKRLDLNAILDHFNISVDNPLTILGQDAARQFLAASSPTDKYKLFMKGTLLTQLAEDYTRIQQGINATSEAINRKKQRLPELEQAMNEANEKVKNMQQAKELVHLVEQLTKEVCWAQVRDAEVELEEVEDQVKAFEAQRPKTQRKIEEVNVELANVMWKLDNATSEFNNAVETLEPIRGQKRSLKAQKQELDSREQDYQAEEKDMTKSIKELREQVNNLQKHIDEENASASSRGGKRQRLLQRLEKLKERETRIREEKEKVDQEDATTAQHVESCQQESAQVTQQVRTVQNQLAQESNLLKDLHAQKTDRLKAFGNNMPDILRAINAHKGWKHMPVGPIGMHITLLEPEWANILEVVIGGFLNAFLVQSYDDQRLLSEIFRKFDCRASIVVAKHDLFDYSLGEPDPKFTTILRVLEFDNEWVKRQLIVNNSIESIILMKNLKQADELMYNNGRGPPKNVTQCYHINGSRVGAKTGMATIALSRYNGRPRLARDVDEKIRETQTRQRELSQQREDLKDRYERLRKDIADLEAKRNSHRRSQQLLNKELMSIANDVRQTNDELQDDEPANISALEASKAETLQQIKVIKSQYEELKAKVEACKTDRESIDHKLQALDIQEQAVQDVLADAKNSIAELTQSRVKCDQHKKYWQDKDEELSRKISERKQAAEGLVANLQTITQQAREYCERVDVTKSTGQLHSDLDKLKARLKSQEEEHGITFEEAEADALEKTGIYNQAKHDIKIMLRFIKAMQESLFKRVRRREKFKSHLITRTQNHFTLHLARRGFSGDLTFKDNTSELIMQIQTEETQNGEKKKEIKSLSGGEKSYVTISLLLSVWDALPSPMRFLDEFDVFMDAANRTASMSTLIRHARDNKSIQYTFITPQGAKGIQHGPDVRIHKLADPERNQATLNF